MRVFAVFSALLKSWLRSKIGIFFSFLFPVMLLIIFSTVFGGAGDTSYTLFVQNFDVENGEPTPLSEGLISALESTDIFDIKDLGTDVDVATYVKENPSFSFSYRILIIPQGFEDYVGGKSLSVKIGVTLDTLTLFKEQYAQYLEGDGAEIEKGQYLLQQVRTDLPAEPVELTLLTDAGDTSAPAMISVIYGVVNGFSNTLVGTEEVVTIKGESLAQRGLKIVDYYLPGFIAAFIMTNGVIGATTTISEYRRDGQVKRLAATPLPKSSWILGNVLQQTVLAFVLTGVMIILGWVIFDVRVIPDFYALLLIFVGAVAFCSVGMVLGGVIKDVEAASGAGNAIAFPMMFLSGAFWPIEMMPHYLQVVAKFLPLHYFHDGLRQIMVLGNPENALNAFLILSVFAVVFIVIALKITRWKEL